jgi:hypothetical protein
VNWSILEDVGDVGPYAKHMLKILTDGVGRIRLALSPAYFQNLCTKLAAVFLDEFLDNVWQLRRVSKTGGGQLLMDLHGIKEYLLKMPNVKLKVKKIEFVYKVHNKNFGLFKMHYIMHCLVRLREKMRL